MKINQKLLFLLFTFFLFYSQNVMAQNKSKANTKKVMYKITVMYPNAEDKKFDMKYYQEKHMPMMRSILGKTLKKLHIDKGIKSSFDPNATVPFLAIGYLYVSDLEEYNKKIMANIDRIRSDFANYYNGAPTVQISEVVE
jgi:uncharacterized protein (TIGR02118 family)